MDVGPAPGEKGGRVLYSGPPDGLAEVAESATAPLPVRARRARPGAAAAAPPGLAQAAAASRGNNLHGLDVDFPLGVFTAVTGVSGSGKSSLVEPGARRAVGRSTSATTVAARGSRRPAASWSSEAGGTAPAGGRIVGGSIARRVRAARGRVDQRPIGRTPRSNLATYTGLFDDVRKLFAATAGARARATAPAGSRSTSPGAAADTARARAFVMRRAAVPAERLRAVPGLRGRPLQPRRRWRSSTAASPIADVLAMTVDAAATSSPTSRTSRRSLGLLRDVGLGYLRLGQPATELSGGEAQRIKLATELQRAQRGHTLYVLDEPTTGLHPADVDRLLAQLERPGRRRQHGRRRRARPAGGRRGATG